MVYQRLGLLVVVLGLYKKGIFLALRMAANAKLVIHVAYEEASQTEISPGKAGDQSQGNRQGSHIAMDAFW